MVADGNAHHGAAVNGRSANLIGRFEVRVKAAIGVHTRVEDQAKVERAGEDAVEETPAKSGELLLTFFVPE